MDNTAIVSKFSPESQEIVKNLLSYAAKLDGVDLKQLFNIVLSELAGYPTLSEAQHTGTTHCGNLFKQLSEVEQMCFLQWLLNLLNPLGLPVSYSEPKDLLPLIQQFVEYDMDRHISYLGIKEPLSHSFDSYMKKISECLREYKFRVSRLERAIDSATSTLDLIAEAESMIQSGNWSNGKAGCLSVFATRLAVQTRDGLRRSYPEDPYPQSRGEF